MFQCLRQDFFIILLRYNAVYAVKAAADEDASGARQGCQHQMQGRVPLHALA